MEEENISQHGNQPSHFGQKKNKPPEDPSPSLLLDKLRVDERDELDLVLFFFFFFLNNFFDLRDGKNLIQK